MEPRGYIAVEQRKVREQFTWYDAAYLDANTGKGVNITGPSWDWFIKIKTLGIQKFWCKPLPTFQPTVVVAPRTRNCCEREVANSDVYSIIHENV